MTSGRPRTVSVVSSSLAGQLSMMDWVGTKREFVVDVSVGNAAVAVVVVADVALRLRRGGVEVLCALKL